MAGVRLYYIITLNEKREEERGIKGKEYQIE